MSKLDPLEFLRPGGTKAGPYRDKYYFGNEADNSGPFDLDKMLQGLQNNAQRIYGEADQYLQKQPDPVNELQNFMDQFQNINVPATPIEQLRQQAESQMNAQFDPLIQALNDQMGQKKQRGARSQGEARSMYGDLGKDFLNQLPGMTEEFAQQDKQTDQRYDSAQQQLQQQYGQQSKEQQAVLDQLGIQAASQGASQQSRDDQKYFQNQMQMDQNQARNSEDLQQTGAEQYQRSLGNNAKMTGENTAQDIGQMLEDYLTTAGSQLGGLKAQKSSGIEALLGQLQAQDQQRIGQAQKNQFDQQMQMTRLQMDLEKMAQSQNKPEEGLFKGTSGLLGAEGYLRQAYPGDTNKSTALLQELNDVLANPDVKRGMYETDLMDGYGQKKTAPVNQEYMMQLLRDELKGAGYDDNLDINNTISALLAYLGKQR